KLGREGRKAVCLAQIGQSAPPPDLGIISILVSLTGTCTLKNLMPSSPPQHTWGRLDSTGMSGHRLQAEVVRLLVKHRTKQRTPITSLTSPPTKRLLPSPKTLGVGLISGSATSHSSVNNGRCCRAKLAVPSST